MFRYVAASSQHGKSLPTHVPQGRPHAINNGTRLSRLAMAASKNGHHLSAFCCCCQRRDIIGLESHASNRFSGVRRRKIGSLVVRVVCEHPLTSVHTNTLCNVFTYTCVHSLLVLSTGNGSVSVHSPGGVEHGEGEVEAPLLWVVFDGERGGVDEHGPSEQLQQHQAVAARRLVQVQYLAGVEKLPNTNRSRSVV